MPFPLDHLSEVEERLQEILPGVLLQQERWLRAATRGLHPEQSTVWEGCDGRAEMPRVAFRERTGVFAGTRGGEERIEFCFDLVGSRESSSVLISLDGKTSRSTLTLNNAPRPSG